MHLQVSPQLVSPCRILPQKFAGVGERHEMAAIRWYVLERRRLVDPFSKLFGHERPDAVKFRERPVIRHELRRLLRPKKRAPRSAPVSTNENTAFLFRLSGE